jgi:hypothetical protein
MKIQTFGRSKKAWPLVPTISIASPFWVHSLWFPLLPANEMGWPKACLAYRQNRENGSKCDNPPRPFPGNGIWYWEEDESLRNTGGTGYWSRAYYDQSKDDEAWMEEKDKNYLARIEKKGKLKELEPAVWYLYKKEHTTNTDIKNWWANKLKNPKLPQLLKQANKKMKEGLLVFWEGRHERLGADSLVKNLPEEIMLQISELVRGKKIPATNLCKQNILDIAPIIPISSVPYQLCCQVCRHIKEFFVSPEPEQKTLHRIQNEFL